jgi:hypothetical protein
VTVDCRRVLRYAVLSVLAASVVGCQSSCSLFTTIDPDDAGHWSFVRQIVPKLLGRKIKGHDEAKLLVDVINATPNNKGREEILNALMRSPEFGVHWSETLVDLLRVNREGIKDNSLCYGTPQRASFDPGIAGFITAQRADLNGFTGTAPTAFNMSDVVSAAVAADNLYAAYAAHIFAFENKPVTGNMVTEANRRDDLGGNFNSIFLHRKIECLQCHRSSFSASGPQTYWQRTWPIWGKPEAAVYENEQGGNPANFNALFRTDVMGSTTPRAPWGGVPGTGSPRGLQSCGAFGSGAPSTDPLGASPYMTQSLPVGSSVWDVQRLLHQGRRTLATDGLVRSQPPACNVCSTTACSTGTFPAPPEPATSNIYTLFQNHNCHTCHRSPSPAGSMDLEDNSPAGHWTNNVIGIDVSFLALGSGVKRIARGDAANSYLITKLRAKLPTTDPGHRNLHPSDSGGPMPPVGHPALAESEIQQVEAWINSLPTGATTPPECAVCASTTCTSLGSELNGPAALAFLVGLNVSDQIWQELMGTRVTIANYFARTQDQMRVLWNLSEFTLIPNDWSLREVTKRILLSEYFNRKSPRTTAASTPYTEPLVLDPWVEADPRVPPISLSGWTPASTTPPAPDPAYNPANNPDKRKNAMSEGVHRYSVRSLTYSMHAALGWPAPQRFPGNSYPSKELVKAIGQFAQDSEPGFRDADFQGLLQWESIHKSCKNTSGVSTDWVDRLLDAIAAFNTANPSAQLALRDVAVVMKDWFIADASVSTTVLSLDDNMSEKQALDSMFGGDIAALIADASPTNRAALETKLREYCGVLVQTPQFWLAGIVPSDPGDTPRIRVCNDSVCSYQDMCTQLDGQMRAAGSHYVLQCGTNTVSVVERPTSGGLIDLCRKGACGFVPLPDDRFQCLIGSTEPSGCFPIGPPPCDLGCSRIDCCGGPLPPLKPDGKPRPAMLLGWFEGSKIGEAKNVRILPAAERRRGVESKWQDAKTGIPLKPGDLLQLPAESVLEVDTPRGAFKTPREGMPANPMRGPWYLMVTGPSVARGEAHPPMPLRWQQRSDEAKRIDTYNQQQKSLLMRSPEKPKHNPAYRQSLRVDQPDDTPRGKPAKSPSLKQP